MLRRFDKPVILASGLRSDVFVDAKRAVAEPAALALVGELMAAAAAEAGADYEAVGGLVLGAVPYTFAVAAAARCRWFLVRKAPKGRGTDQWLEGAAVGRGTRVMLVDDVVTTGASIGDAHRRVRELGATVAFATTLLDRGDVAGRSLAEAGVPYAPLLTYADVGIDPVEPVPARPA